METKTICANCGSSWKVNVQEDAELVAELATCPLCSRKEKEE